MKRPVTIVPIDSLVIVDKISRNVNLSATDKSIHAIQWRGAPSMTGFIEYVESVDGTKPPNTPIGVDEYNTVVHPCVVLWEKGK